MKITKYEHACVILENDSGEKIVIDPGSFTNLPSDLSNVMAIVITHSHADHFFLKNINKITKQSPYSKLFGSTEVVKEISEATNPNKDRAYKLGQFELRFYGDKHEFIREGIPIIDNLGVIINDQVAYPGDSYSQHPGSARYLLIPASAPWLRMKEASEFITNAKAENIIPTHDAMLSEIGKNTYDNHFTSVSNNSGKKYMRLDIGQSLKIDQI